MDPLLIDIPECLETPRLLLLAPHTGEAEEMNRAIVESAAELKPWMPWADPVPTLEATRIWCQRSLARYAAREEIYFRLYQREPRVYGGNVSLCRMDWGVPRFEIGYWIRTSLTRRGYATEAAKALTDFAMNALKANRVEIHMDELNVASRRVAERAGFSLEGILRNHTRAPNGRLQNMCVYSKIANPAD
jgi:ribosomal-protein-serine acetyltransferase